MHVLFTIWCVRKTPLPQDSFPKTMKMTDLWKLFKIDYINKLSLSIDQREIYTQEEWEIRKYVTEKKNRESGGG